MSKLRMGWALVAFCFSSACGSDDPGAMSGDVTSQAPPPMPGAAGSAAPPSPMAMQPMAPPTAMQPSAPMGGQPSAPMPAAGSAAEPMPMEPEPMQPEETWESLIETEWEVPPNTENYLCVRRTLDEDVFVTAFKALNPYGTHHTVLTVGNPNGADGVTPCNSGVNNTGGVYGSGVGTDVLRMPEGVAFPIRAGQQLVLNLHLFNTTDEPLIATSGTLVQTAQEADVEHMSEVALVTALLFSIPPMEVTTGGGQCTMSHDVTAFAILPHMHTLGSHARVVVERAEGDLVLHDMPFEFEQQTVYPIDPVQLREGEVVRTECTWNNTTDRVVGFGESSLDEMCNIAVFRYPAGENPVFACGF